MSIQVHNFSFSYNQKPFLRNLCFNCSGGQVVALLGENGSGNSTLISCLAGMKSVRGIDWMNRPLLDWSIADQAKHRALVPQHFIFAPSRVVLARAFAQDTPLLLLDEPLNNLDLVFR